MKTMLKNIVIVFTFLTVLTPLVTFNSCKSGEEEPNPCDITCQNAGELIIVEDYCYCECPPGFEGDQCEIAPE